jgi:hypothetical protein
LMEGSIKELLERALESRGMRYLVSGVNINKNARRNGEEAVELTATIPQGGTVKFITAIYLKRNKMKNSEIVWDFGNKLDKAMRGTIDESG